MGYKANIQQDNESHLHAGGKAGPKSREDSCVDRGRGGSCYKGQVRRLEDHEILGHNHRAAKAARSQTHDSIANLQLVNICNKKSIQDSD